LATNLTSSAACRPPLWLLYTLALLLATMRPVYFPVFQGFLVDRVVGARRVVVNAYGRSVHRRLQCPSVGNCPDDPDQLRVDGS